MSYTTRALTSPREGSTKAELLARLRHLIAQMRGLAATSVATSDEVAVLELDVAAVEADLARVIDEFMCRRYESHNADMAATKKSRPQPARRHPLQEIVRTYERA